MTEYRNTLKAYINTMKGAFTYNEEMKMEYEGLVDYLEKEMKKYQTAEWYRMTIADLDSILQWYEN